MKDLDKYGKHLRSVVDAVRALPASEQRAQANVGVVRGKVMAPKLGQASPKGAKSR